MDGCQILSFDPFFKLKDLYTKSFYVPQIYFTGLQLRLARIIEGLKWLGVYVQKFWKFDFLFEKPIFLTTRHYFNLKTFFFPCNVHPLLLSLNFQVNGFWQFIFLLSIIFFINSVIVVQEANTKFDRLSFIFQDSLVQKLFLILKYFIFHLWLKPDIYFCCICLLCYDDQL